MSLTLSLQPSRQLFGYLILIHTGAVLCLTLSAAPWWLKVAGVGICLFSVWYSIRKYALLSHPQAIVQCTALEDNLWLLTDRQGKQQTACLLGDSWRSRYMLILNFKFEQSGKRLSVILPSDMLDPPALRRLRVYLTVLL